MKQAEAEVARGEARHREAATLYLPYISPISPLYLPYISRHREAATRYP